MMAKAIRWQLPKGAFFGTSQRRTLAQALDAYAAQHGSAVGVWHVVMHNEHYMFANEADARRCVADAIRWERKGFALEREIDPTTRFRVRRNVPPRKIRDATSGREYRGSKAGRSWSSNRRLGSIWHLALYQRTQEMERARALEERKAFDAAVAQAQAAFAKYGPVWCDSWEGHLSDYAKRWGREHGLLEGTGRDARWIGATSGAGALRGGEE